MTDEPKKCPQCGLANNASAETCGCGHNPPSGHVAAPRSPPHPWFRVVVMPLCTFAVLMALFVLVMPEFTVRVLPDHYQTTRDGLIGESSPWFEWPRRMSGAFWIAVVALLAAPFACRVGHPMLRKALMAVGFSAYALVVLWALVVPDIFRSGIPFTELWAVRNLRYLLSAQEAYREATEGFAPTLACLIRTTDCITDYPPSRPAFLEPASYGSLAHLADGFENKTGDVGGYVYEMHPGRVVLGDNPYAIFKPPYRAVSLVTSFAVVAVPRTPGENGLRAFCADSRGVVCFSKRGGTPPIRNGACEITPMLCEVLR